MKKILLHIVIWFSCMLIAIPVFSQKTDQDTIKGIVSYKTSQSIYVRFESTTGISVGDTLFMLDNGVMNPVLTVKYKSTTSCVGVLINPKVLETGTHIIAKKNTAREILPVPDDIVEIPTPVITPEQSEEAEQAEEPETKKRPTEKITGRISAASYVYFAGDPENDKQRMRYTFNLNAKNVANTNFSAESYISFRHTINDWQEVKDHFGKTFKVYSLAIQYNVDDKINLWLGRKINYNISNVGAIDGIQAEKTWNKTLVGLFAGSRPDHEDYGFNYNLLQFGAYAGYKAELKNGSLQNTIAIAEQRNNGMTDRRFAYFQHLNSAIKRIYIFTSFEFDLYTLENNQPKNTFNISSLYASIRYKANDKLSLFASYDARKNIIYYETYKNFIDQLLEDETRQGFRLSFNYRPLKRITIGSSGGYRFQKDNPVVSKNLHSYLMISRIPKLGISATVSTVWIQSAYLTGIIYGLRASRDIINGKLFAEAEYRIVENKLINSESLLKQSIVGANISWRISKKISLSCNYEGDIRDKELSSRIYSNIINRF